MEIIEFHSKNARRSHFYDLVPRFHPLYSFSSSSFASKDRQIHFQLQKKEIKEKIHFDFLILQRITTSFSRINRFLDSKTR